MWTVATMLSANEGDDIEVHVIGGIWYSTCNMTSLHRFNSMIWRKIVEDTERLNPLPITTVHVRCWPTISATLLISPCGQIEGDIFWIYDTEIIIKKTPSLLDCTLLPLEYSLVQQKKENQNMTPNNTRDVKNVVNELIARVPGGKNEVFQSLVEFNKIDPKRFLKKLTVWQTVGT